MRPNGDNDDCGASVDVGDDRRSDADAEMAIVSAPMGWKRY